MALDRLIRRESLDTIQYGIVRQVDEPNKRVKVLRRNSLEVWASYVPDDFSGLAAGQTVAIAMSEITTFLVRRLSSALPEGSTILEV